MAYREPRPLFPGASRRLSTTIQGRTISYGSYYADEPAQAPAREELPEHCTLCTDGTVFPVWHREPTLEEARAYQKLKLQVPDRITIQDPPETCYRCEGTGHVLKEWRRRLTIEEARQFVFSARTC
jgi:hypothetical protein